MTDTLMIFGEARTAHASSNSIHGLTFVGECEALGIVVRGKDRASWDATITAGQPVFFDNGFLDTCNRELSGVSGLKTKERARDWAEQTARQILVESLERAKLSAKLGPEFTK